MPDVCLGMNIINTMPHGCAHCIYTLGFLIRNLTAHTFYFNKQILCSPKCERSPPRRGYGEETADISD